MLNKYEFNFHFLSAYILEASQLIKNEKGTTVSFSHTQ